MLRKLPSPGICLVLLSGGLFGMTPAESADPETSPSLEAEPLAAARALGTAFADLAEAVGPATVHISAQKAQGLSPGLAQVLSDYRLPLPAPTGPSGGISTGSGVLLTPDGHVLTNHHVVSAATDLFVTLKDKRRFPAELIGSDPRTDIAILRIDAPDTQFPYAELGDSDELRIGEWVVAIGHPFEFSFTVTAGIVSARGRRNLDPTEISDFIQTDAAVNPGSSGGPLFNLDGEVVGINTALFNPGPNAAHAGISLAIPVNMARRIVDELERTGRVGRAAIGVTTQDRPPTRENPRPGAEITRVLANSPAEEAGLRVGDVIIAVEDEPVADSSELKGMVLARALNAPTRMQIERDNFTLTKTVRPRDTRDLSMPDLVVPADAVEWGGMVLAPLTPERSARLGLTPPSGEEPRLVALAVAPASAASAAGLSAGDLILSAGGSAIHTANDLGHAVRGKRSIAINFWRDNRVSVAILAGLERRDLPTAPPGG